ncbi:MAG: glucose 1-dehydrogenase [Acidimicrobiia bacterium]|jgi:3alpha(or 20beta)-hydroxysteroid dehydrogenase
MGRLDGKVAIISGGARGQGEAEARLFAEEGAEVVLGDVLDAQGAEVAAEIGAAARYVHLDVRDEASWAAAIAAAEDAFGPVTVLVNNAGILRFSLLVETPVEQFREVIEVNQVGPFLGMKAVVPSMQRAGGGSIVNISSTNGLGGFPATVSYTSTKWAVRGMTKTAAMELGPLGIRVNSIHPGGIDTEMVRPSGEVEGLPDADTLGQRFAHLPLGRVGQPIEIARLALFLASDESSYSTGSEFVADGGMLAGPRTEL